MNSIGIIGTEQIILGIYLLAHGLIHGIFLFYFKDNKTNVFTGWSGKSWLLSKLLSDGLVKSIGYMIWVSIIILFSISGLAILDLLKIGHLLVPILGFVCCLAIIGYILFFKDLFPTPYHWILGTIIDLSILVFIIFFKTDIQILLIVLIAIWLYGIFFHIKIVSHFTTNILAS